MPHKQLEQYAWFPYIAWTVSLGFALFVGYLALELRTTADDLRDTSLSMEQRMEAVEAMLNEGNATTSNGNTETTTE